MTKHDFIGAYVASFLASYNAGRYIEFCMNDRAKDLAILEHQPVEDSVFMAEEAWLGYVEHYVEPENKRPIRFGDVIQIHYSKGHSHVQVMSQCRSDREPYGVETAAETIARWGRKGATVHLIGPPAILPDGSKNPDYEAIPGKEGT